MANFVFQEFIKRLGGSGADIDWDGVALGTIRVALMEVAVTTSVQGAAECGAAGMTSSEIDTTSGNGYGSGFAGAGRKTLDNTASIVTSGTNIIRLDTVGDTTWTALNLSALSETLTGAFVFYSVTGAAADTNLIPIAHFDISGAPSGQDYTINWNANGLVQFTLS